MLCSVGAESFLFNLVFLLFEVFVVWYLIIALCTWVFVNCCVQLSSLGGWDVSGCGCCVGVDGWGLVWLLVKFMWFESYCVGFVARWLLV